MRCAFQLTPRKKKHCRSLPKWIFTRHGSRSPHNWLVTFDSNDPTRFDSLHWMIHQSQTIKNRVREAASGDGGLARRNGTALAVNIWLTKGTEPKGIFGRVSRQDSKIEPCFVTFLRKTFSEITKKFQQELHGVSRFLFWERNRLVSLSNKCKQFLWWWGLDRLMGPAEWSTDKYGLSLLSKRNYPLALVYFHG